MKIKNLFITLGLALAAVGVAAGVGAANSNAKEVKAETLTNKMYLQLNNSTWNDKTCAIVLRFSDGGSNHEWGSKFTPDGSSKYNEYSYSLSFTPTKVRAYKVNPESTVADWIDDEKDSSDWVWAYSNEVNYHDVLWLGSYYPYQRVTEGDSYTLDVSIKGGASDNWTGVPVVDTKLTSVKVSNDKSKIEAYGLVTIPANTYFKANKSADSGWYGTYDAESGISARFSNTTGEGSQGNILDTVGGTYEIFFKFDEDNTLWITDPISAAADEWAQAFLGSGLTACNSVTKANWGDLADDYEELEDSYGTAFTNIFTTVAYVDHEASVSGYISLAVQRYDYVLERYGINNANTDALGYEDFMGREGKLPSGSGSVQIASSENNTNNTTLIIVLASVITLAAVGGYFLLRKRED